MRTTYAIQGKRRQRPSCGRVIATLGLVAALAETTYGALTRDHAPRGGATAAAVSDGFTPQQVAAGWRRAADD